MTDRPYEERLGGSYVRDRGEAEARLVERTTEPAAASAEPATQPTAEPTAESAKKTRRSD